MSYIAFEAQWRVNGERATLSDAVNAPDTAEIEALFGGMRFRVAPPDGDFSWHVSVTIEDGDGEIRIDGGGEKVDAINTIRLVIENMADSQQYNIWYQVYEYQS